MGTKIEAFIKPQLLIWARESAGYDVSGAAKKIGIKPEKLEAWEKGLSRPSIQQLQKIASAYKRPLAIFFLSEPPRTFDAMHDFRRLVPYEEERKSPSLLFEIRKAYQRREIAIELSELLNEPPVSFEMTINITDKPENVSRAIRKYIGVTLERQLEARDRNEALNLWRESIEGLGVLIFQTNSRSQIPLGEMRGFSISNRPYPVIVLNSKDSPSGRIFTLIHEFTHLLLENGGICDMEDYGEWNSEDQQVEFFCNATAGEVLVPKSSLLDNATVQASNTGRVVWDDNELQELADQYSVSREVILRRLLTIGKTTPDFYKERRLEYLKIEQKKTSGFAPFHRLVVRDNGPSYIRLILNAYQQELITTSNLSDYLGTKLKHLYNIERDVSMTQSRVMA
jgi:Zn-dependent peptidase ImmA (M78 family)/DNA-binding XRE family transcriptional regulator